METISLEILASLAKDGQKSMTKAMAEKSWKAKKATALYRIAMCQRSAQYYAKCFVQKVCRALYCNCKNIQNLFRFGTMPCQRHVHGQSLLAVAMFNLLADNKSRGLAKLQLQPELSEYVQ